MRVEEHHAKPPQRCRVAARSSYVNRSICVVCFFFQAEDGIRDLTVTGVQTCALPISPCLPYSPIAPRKPVNGMSCPIRMGSCARTTAGNASSWVPAAAPTVARPRNLRRGRGGGTWGGLGLWGRERTRLNSRHRQKSYGGFFF